MENLEGFLENDFQIFGSIEFFFGNVRNLENCLGIFLIIQNFGGKLEICKKSKKRKVDFTGNLKNSKILILIVEEMNNIKIIINTHNTGVLDKENIFIGRI